MTIQKINECFLNQGSVSSPIPMLGKGRPQELGLTAKYRWEKEAMAGEGKQTLPGSGEAPSICGEGLVLKNYYVNHQEPMPLWNTQEIQGDDQELEGGWEHRGGEVAGSHTCALRALAPTPCHHSVLQTQTNKTKNKEDVRENRL